jgi:hypothetical protein
MQAEGLDHEIVGAQIEAADTCVDFLASGKHQDRQAVVNGSNLGQDLLPVFHGQIEIENGQVGQFLFERLDRGAAVMGYVDAVSVDLKSATQKRSKGFVILSDQQSHGSLSLGGVFCSLCLPGSTPILLLSES